MKITALYEAKCPICNRTTIGFYCPSCGLPLKIGVGHKWHTCPEFGTYSIYLICKKCDTPNPNGAQYCRNCGEKMYECKFNNIKGTLRPRNLDDVKHGGNAEDIIKDGDIYKIIERSCEGFYDENFGKNSMIVIMERCIKKENGKIEGAGEAPINLSAFDRAVVPYKKLADGTVTRDGEAVRANGTAVATWKATRNAKAFMSDNKGKVMRYKLKAEIQTRAWDRAVEEFSKTELRTQKVYTIDWV